MGSIISRAFIAPKQSMVNVLPEEEEEKGEMGKVDSMNLPCPFPYHRIRREANRILNPSMFEGMRCGLLNRVDRISDKFIISHKLTMDQMEIPYYAPEICKSPTADYEFGASFIHPKLLLIGKIDKQGTLKGCARFNHADRFFCNVNGELPMEIYWSYGTLSFDYKGNHFQSRFQVETDGSCSANYIQSVHPNLSLGTKLLWLGDQTRSVTVFAARYSTGKVIATGEVSTNKSILLSYVQNLSKKASIASSFQYDNAAGYAISSFGYQYKFREAVLRGKVDSNGVISSHVMRKLGTRARLVLAAELNHVMKNYKFGYGLEWGAVPDFPNESGILQ